MVPFSPAERTRVFDWVFKVPSGTNTRSERVHETPSWASSDTYKYPGTWCQTFVLEALWNPSRAIP